MRGVRLVRLPLKFIITKLIRLCSPDRKVLLFQWNYIFFKFWNQPLWAAFSGVAGFRLDNPVWCNHSSVKGPRYLKAIRRPRWRALHITRKYAGSHFICSGHIHPGHCFWVYGRLHGHEDGQRFTQPRLSKPALIRSLSFKRTY